MATMTETINTMPRGKVASGSVRLVENNNSNLEALGSKKRDNAGRTGGDVMGGQPKRHALEDLFFPESDPIRVPLPPVTFTESEDLQEPSDNASALSEKKSSSGNENSLPKEDVDIEHKNIPGPPPIPTEDTKEVSRKKSFSVFGTLRRLSTTNLKHDHKKSSPTSPTKSHTPVTPITPIEHVEAEKNPSPPAIVENGGKKSRGGLLKSIRAAIRMSSKSAPNSPTVPSITAARSPSSPLSPISPLSSRTPQKEAPRSPVRPTSSRLSERPLSTQPSKRHSTRPSTATRQSYHMPTPLRPASTWSPAATNPVLISNPHAKLYTVWPRYPIIDTQIAEVQDLLEGLLPNDKSAIEISREPGSQLVIHYWKAPLTSEQAEVVKSNKLVSSIQLSKLDYDMSDMF